MFKSKYIKLDGIWIILIFSAVIVFCVLQSIKILFPKNALFRNIFTDNQYALTTGVFLAIFGIYGLYRILNRNPKDLELLKNQKYITVSDVIISNPYNSGGGKGKKTTLKLSKFPNFNFYYQAARLTSKKSEHYNKHVNKGDSISLKIKEVDYLKKLKSSIKLDFYDKHFDFEDIRVFEIKKGIITYLTIEQQIESASWSNSKIEFYTILVLFIMLIVAGSFLILLFILKVANKS